jgi:hypothetical protein
MTRDIPIVCAATHPIQWTMGDEEVKGRWNDIFHLQQYTGPRLDGLLATLELFLPFSQDSHLVERAQSPGKGTADLIEQWTGGILRDIMILIRDARSLGPSSKVALAWINTSWKSPGEPSKPNRSPISSIWCEHGNRGEDMSDPLDDTLWHSGFSKL